MKTLITISGSLVFSVFLLAARAQTPATPPGNPGPAKTAAQTADRRAKAYQGPKVVPNTKALGNEMLRDSKPTDSRRPTKVAPVPK